MNLVKQYAPKVEIHISTQAGIVNYAMANALYDMGAKRIVLAREYHWMILHRFGKNTCGFRNRNICTRCYVHVLFSAVAYCPLI